MKNRLTVMGCGNSTGVPAIGNYWGDCDPAEPKNERSRASVLVRTARTTLVVDTGPDFRMQLNREDVRAVDAILYTHHHGDHVDGMNELRVLKFRNQKLVPVYGNQETLDDLRARFSYMFDGGNHEIYPPMIEPHIFTPDQLGQKQTIGDIEFIPFEQDHGSCISIGYRFGDVGYSVDMRNLEEEAIRALRGVKVWIADCAAYHQKNPAVHAGLDDIYRLNKEIGAEQVYLTSLSLRMDYQTLIKELPEGYVPAYDGLVVPFV